METPEAKAEKPQKNGSTLDKVVQDIRDMGEEDPLAKKVQEKIQEALGKRHKTAKDILDNYPGKFGSLEDVYKNMAQQPDKSMEGLSITLLSTRDEEDAQRLLRQIGALEEGQSLLDIDLEEKKGVRYGKTNTRHERAKVKVLEENGKKGKKVTLTLFLNPAASLEAMKRYKKEAKED